MKTVRYPQQLSQEKLCSFVAPLLPVNAMPLDFTHFPESYPSIIASYGLAQLSSTTSASSGDTSLLTKPSLAFSKWTELLADINFRVPPIYFALQASKVASNRSEDVNMKEHLTGGDIFVYSIHATNPFPLWPTSYRRANHAINDILVFDVAPDIVSIQSKNEAGDEDDIAYHWVEYRGAVADMQGAWIQFCHGIRPWRQFSGHADGERGLGPIYVFKNSGLSREYASVREAEGPQLEEKWIAILEAARAWTTK